LFLLSQKIWAQDSAQKQILRQRLRFSSASFLFKSMAAIFINYVAKLSSAAQAAAFSLANFAEKFMKRRRLCADVARG
jgi:hypothetical protein